MSYTVEYNLLSVNPPLKKIAKLKDIPEFETERELHDYLRSTIAVIEGVPEKHIRITKYV